MDDNTYGFSGSGVPWVQNALYDPAGHLTSMTRFNGATLSSDPSGWSNAISQTMGYNVNGQLTSLGWGLLPPYTGYWVWGLTYSYSGTQNNGQITQMTDSRSGGETAVYAYDQLKRLTSASASGAATWTEAFLYDGFGNLTSKSLNHGANSAPAVDPTTNRLTSGYDANGNMLTGYGLTLTYDGRNRMASASPTSGGTEYYGYAPDNKRIYRWNPTTGTEEWTFYGIGGERMGAFAQNVSGYSVYPTETNVRFRGNLITRLTGGTSTSPPASLVLVTRDQLGSDLENNTYYYPYGEEVSPTANGVEKFGTYFRDSFTTLDYADQRYYASSYGRLNTVDPLGRSVILSEPLSWNRYAYCMGDAVNCYDPTGLIAWRTVLGGATETVVGVIVLGGSLAAEAPTVGASTAGVLASAPLLAHGLVQVIVGLTSSDRKLTPKNEKNLKLAGQLMTPGGLIAGILSGGNTTAVAVGATISDGIGGYNDINELVGSTTAQGVAASTVTFLWDAYSFQDDSEGYLAGAASVTTEFYTCYDPYGNSVDCNNIGLAYSGGITCYNNIGQEIDCSSVN